jgi:hypothetical protein
MTTVSAANAAHHPCAPDTPGESGCALDGARRDAAALALLQARTRLDMLARILRPRVAWSLTARRMLAVVDAVSPLVTALECLLPESKP